MLHAPKCSEAKNKRNVHFKDKTTERPFFLRVSRKYRRAFLSALGRRYSGWCGSRCKSSSRRHTVPLAESRWRRRGYLQKTKKRTAVWNKPRFKTYVSSSAADDSGVRRTRRGLFFSVSLLGARCKAQHCNKQLSGAAHAITKRPDAHRGIKSHVHQHARHTRAHGALQVAPMRFSARWSIQQTTFNAESRHAGSTLEQTKRTYTPDDSSVVSLRLLQMMEH